MLRRRPVVIAYVASLVAAFLAGVMLASLATTSSATPHEDRACREPAHVNLFLPRTSGAPMTVAPTPTPCPTLPRTNAPSTTAEPATTRAVQVRETPTPLSLPPFRFYIHEEVNNVDKVCFVCWTYTCTTAQLYRLLKNHPWRTRDPAEAQLFWIPFSIEASYYAVPPWRPECNDSRHQERVERTVTFLRNNEWFKRHNGRDHFWDALHWLVGEHPEDKEEFGGSGKGLVPLIDPALLVHGGLFQHIVKGAYIRYRQQRFDPPKYNTSYDQWEWNWIRFQVYKRNLDPITARSVLVPININTKPNATLCQYDRWIARPKLFYFRGSRTNHKTFAPRQRNFLLNTIRHLLPNSTIEPWHAQNDRTFEAEVPTHRFCIVVRGDDLQTSRVMDGIAVGCIPVFMSDGWREHVAPFGDIVNWDAISFTIPQTAWMDDPEGAFRAIISQPEFVYRAKLAAIVEAQPKLLWQHPRTVVHELTLREAYTRTQDAFVDGELSRPLAHYKTTPDNPAIRWTPVKCQVYMCSDNETKAH